MSNVARIGAGTFSQAFSFQSDRTTFMVRLNRYGEDFQKDLICLRAIFPKITILKIVERGRFDRDYYFAIAAMREDLEDYDRIRARMQTFINAG